MLEPLTRADADPLLHDAPASRRDALYEQSGGNPLYLEALLKGSDPLSFVGDELDALSPEARTLAQGAAVAAEPFGPELAAAAAELDDPLGALDELLAADLIRATDIPRRFRFRHPIVRHAIYSAAGRRLAARRARPSGAVLARQGARRRAARAPPRAVRGARRRARHRRARAGRRGGGAARARSPPRTGGRPRCDCSRPTATTSGSTLLVPRATALGAAGELAESRDALYEALALIPQSRRSKARSSRSSR